MLERVLVPLDGTLDSETVLPAATRMADRRNCRITLLRVIPPVPAYPGLDLPRLAERDRRESRAYLRDRVKRLEGDGFQVRARILEGGEADMILRAAREDRATVIAMATHARSGLWHLTVGSVARSVLRNSKVPILLVRSSADRPPSTRKPPRILFPVDGIRPTRAMLPSVRDLAGRLHAEIVVLPAQPGRDPIVVAQPVVDALKSAGVPAWPVDARGGPVERILEAAGEADLIVMAGPERPGLAGWIGGDVTERVVRASSVPVVVVPAAARKAAVA